MNLFNTVQSQLFYYTHRVIIQGLVFYILQGGLIILLVLSTARFITTYHYLVNITLWITVGYYETDCTYSNMYDKVDQIIQNARKWFYILQYIHTSSTFEFQFSAKNRTRFFVFKFTEWLCTNNCFFWKRHVTLGKM